MESYFAATATVRRHGFSCSVPASIADRRTLGKNLIKGGYLGL